MSHFEVWGNGYGRHDDDFDYSSLRRDKDESESQTGSETPQKPLNGRELATLGVLSVLLGLRPGDFEQPAPSSKEKAR